MEYYYIINYVVTNIIFFPKRAFLEADKSHTCKAQVLKFDFFQLFYYPIIQTNAKTPFQDHPGLADQASVAVLIRVVGTQT